MDFLFLKQLIVDCTKFIPGLRLADKQKPHLITLCKVLNIVNRQSDYTYIIPYTTEIDADGIIDILERLIKSTLGLSCSIISDQDPLFMSGEFQEWLQVNEVRHEVSSTYHPESDGYTERKNEEIAEMFAVAQLEGDDWLTAVPKIQAKVNARQNKSRGECPFFTLYGFPPKLSLSELPHSIPIDSDPANDLIRQQKSSPKPNMIQSYKLTSTAARHPTIRSMTKSSSLLTTFQWSSINSS